MENEFSFTHKVESTAQEILMQKCICDFQQPKGSLLLFSPQLVHFIFHSVSLHFAPVQTERE